MSETTESVDGMERFWDHEDCPHDWCDGEIQQQDKYNVMCLDCEAVWIPVLLPATVRSDPPAHQLQGPDGKVWAEKDERSNAETDRHKDGEPA